jgi:predicted RNA binding protein YcfA (HicA-like mRNA interferase family)
LRPVEARIVIKALGRIGFFPVRQKGSHLFLKHPDGRSTVIPVHPGEELGRGILMEIMSHIGFKQEGVS